MKYSIFNKKLIFSILLLFLSGLIGTTVFSAPIVYEDAEDGLTTGWTVSDNDPTGAMISNVFDTDKSSLVIELSGDSVNNSYLLRDASGSDWNNSTHIYMSWNMNFGENFTIYVKVETDSGIRRLIYQPLNHDNLGTGTDVFFGLGESIIVDGWRTITRDLQTDLAKAQPGVTILEVDNFTVRGSGRLDDIQLMDVLPPDIDSDLDTLTDADEVGIYGTSPVMQDTDGDGIDDATEVAFWGVDWSSDFDSDTYICILDEDSDDDGYPDGIEKESGTDPSDPLSYPSSYVYEDAQDGYTYGWFKYEETEPEGYTITNLPDPDLGSRVIELVGDAMLNGFLLVNRDGTQWNNTAYKVFSWKGKFSDFFYVYVDVDTDAGDRHMVYEARNYDRMKNGNYVVYGIGESARYGEWKTFARDLQYDLSRVEPGVTILEIDGFVVRGSGRIDDVMVLDEIPPDLDSDGDGLTDAEEMYTYNTSPYIQDTDGDGYSDGEEVTYWESHLTANWDSDSDGDALLNLLDYDADDDGFPDGMEIDAGTDPADPASKPDTIFYEDAEDTLIDGWEIFDNIPAGAAVSNEYDADLDSLVIELAGSGILNGYRFVKANGDDFNNTAHGIVSWKSNFSSHFSIYIKVETDVGDKYLVYEPRDTDLLGTGNSMVFGLGSTAKDGQWHEFFRDLQADINKAQPGVTLIAINQFIVRGSGRIDDIAVRTEIPAGLDSDGDGLSNVDEINIYGTSPNRVDTDGDGLDDDDELAYWGADWSADVDGDGLANIIDIDSDDDGFNDGFEIRYGSDPADPLSKPERIVYEDAESGASAGWRIIDNVPAGASVESLYEAELCGNVVELVGSGILNGFELLDPDGNTWDNSTHQILTWKMKADSNFSIYIKVLTDIGVRYVVYQPKDTGSSLSGNSILVGIGASAMDGVWHAYYRNLQDDIHLQLPGVTLLEVIGMTIRGAGKMDDIALLTTMPDAMDTDGDTIEDAEELGTYGTSPFCIDTDGDGINDNDEIVYWGGNWNSDPDSDSKYNILDPDSDNDGYFDGTEVLFGSDPANPNSTPSTELYEDAEDGLTAGWIIFDDTPAGASIVNSYDAELDTNVICVSGSIMENGFRKLTDAGAEWNNSTLPILSWKIKIEENFNIYVRVTTDAGGIYMVYQPVNEDLLGSDAVILYGIGEFAMNGEWHTFYRNLQEDLDKARPGVTILEVDHFSIRGSGCIDDIKMLIVMPDLIDTDGDTLFDVDEDGVYGTSPFFVDTDGDGVDDNDELAYWGPDNWNGDPDSDGLINLVDYDSDDDGYNDGLELSFGTDPGDPSSIPSVLVYEDAEDGNTEGWTVFDNDPAGATVTNVYDGDLSSNVIAVAGDGMLNGYRLRNADGSEWDNVTHSVMAWKMKFSETFSIYIKVTTDAGVRYLIYQPVDGDGLGGGSTVLLGLGTSAKDGLWHSFARDLQADLNLAQPGVTILEIDEFSIRGSGRLDDIELRTSL